MATYIGIRALTRRGLRIGTTLVSNTTTTEVDIDDPKVRRDLQKHMTLGSFIVVEAHNPGQANS